MEIIEIPGYTEEEKLGIAQRYLIPRQLNEHGITEKHVKIAEPAIRQIIIHYTREAGVRNLEREIANVMRKVAKKVAEGKGLGFPVNAGNLHKYLGVPKFVPESELEKDEIGVATGLAWTESGGDVLSIRANGFDYAIARDDGIWVGTQNLGSAKAIFLLDGGGALLAVDGQVRLLRSDGTEVDFAVAGAGGFVRMSDRYVQVITDSGMWALDTELGHEQISLLPGGSR